MSNYEKIAFSPQQRFIYTHQQHVRVDDINYGNHLAAISLPTMLHQTRLLFLTTHNYSEQDIAGTGLIIASYCVDLLSQAYFNDCLEINLGIEEFSKHSCTFIYQLTNKNSSQIMAKARERAVFFDYKSQKIAQTPEQLIALVKQLEQ